VRSWIRLAGYLRPYTRRVVLAVLCMLGYAAASGLSLGLISPFTQVLFGGAAKAASPAAQALPTVRWPAILQKGLLPWLTGGSAHESLTRITTALVIAFILKNVFDYLQQYLMVWVEQAMVRDLRRDLYAHLQRLSLRFFHGERMGELTSRVVGDVQFIRGALASGFASMVRDSLFLIVCLFWVFWASWQLALVSLILVPPVAALVVLLGRRARKNSEVMQERLASLTGVLAETLGNIRVVKAFGAEGFEERRFDEENREYFRAFVRVRRLAALAGPMAELTLVLLAAGVLGYGGYLIYETGALHASDFFLFLVALLSIVSPVRNLSGINATLQEGLAAADRIFRFMDQVPEVQSKSGARRATGLAEAIRFENVTFRYGDGPPALDRVDLTLRRGERVALVGLSGAGKSTLVDLLPRFYDPTAGRITLDGTDLRDLDLASLRALFGIVPQESILFRDSVAANIAYGRDDPDPHRVEAAARAANASGFVERLEHGYDTVIGERGATLSGGERQRLSLARAVYKDPPILILDEATSHLDSESERIVQEAIEKLMRERTVVLIAHRLSTVLGADRIVVLDQGRVIEQGTHAELLAHDGVYRRLHELQFSAT
jgi:ATP-binding cassette, subfamily B, bacterial MsbA